MVKSKINVLMASLFVSASLFGATATSDWVSTGTIAGTPHDLSTTTTGDNGEVCVYCHTPHAGNTDMTGAPLWNKSSAAGTTTYMMYGATTADTAGSTIGSTATDATPANPSLACLSCHDGISAIDSIVNAPGSGAGSLATGADTMVTYMTAISGVDNGNIGTGPVGSATVVDLTNDHPVSIIYDATKASLRATTTDLSTTNSATAEWVGAVKISDLLRGTAKDRVECGSCHDPHNGYALTADRGTAAAPQVNYLRYTNNKSELCFGCHNK